MKKLIFFWLFISLILFSNLVISAPPSFLAQSDNGYIVSVPNLESIKLNEDFNLHVHVVNKTSGGIINNTLCYAHLYDQTGMALTENEIEHEPISNEYELIIKGANFSIKGLYEFRIFCADDDNAGGGLTDGSYYVTTYGFYPAGDVSTVFIYLLFIVASVSAVFSSFMVIIKLIMKSETIIGVITSWSAFILIIISEYLSKAYLLTYFIEDLTSSFIIAFGFLLVILPIISLIITMIVKGFEKKKPIDPSELMGRGRFAGYG